MKRFLALLICVFLILSLVACGNESTQTNDGSLSAGTVSQTTDTTNDAVSNPTSSEESKPAADKGQAKDGLDADFKAAMDSYEKFMDEYVAFMKKYSANPTDLSLLSDYADYMSDYADFIEDFEDWENEDLNSEELAYYIDVQARVSKKLLEVAQ